MPTAGVILGDGAPWIWALADECFPDAIQIVDIFHAKSHLWDVAKAIYTPGSELAAQWAKQRRDELDAGRISALVAALARHAPTCDEGAEPAGVQLGTPVLGPLVGQVRPGAVEGLGHVAEMLLGMVCRRSRWRLETARRRRSKSYVARNI